VDRVSEPINSGPCRYCWGDHPDERCTCPEKEEVDAIGSAMPPDTAAALEIWGRKQFRECREELCRLEETDYSDWEAYNLMCVDCDEHDKCFEVPDWFKEENIE